jgi:hypothetical protein
VPPGLEAPQQRIQLLQLAAVVLQQAAVREEQLAAHQRGAQGDAAGKELLCRDGPGGVGEQWGGGGGGQGGDWLTNPCLGT